MLGLILILHIRSKDVHVAVQFLFISRVVQHFIVHSNLRHKPRHIIVFILPNNYRLVKSRFSPLAARLYGLGLKDPLALKVLFKLPRSVLILFPLSLIRFASSRLI